jgi:hypothetical protein
MHSSALDERFALDPAEDVAAFLVDAEPARRSVEARFLEPLEDLSHQARSRRSRPVHGPADPHDGVVSGASYEGGLVVSRD